MTFISLIFRVPINAASIVFSVVSLLMVLTSYILSRLGNYEIASFIYSSAALVIFCRGMVNPVMNTVINVCNYETDPITRSSCTTLLHRQMFQSQSIWFIIGMICLNLGTSTKRFLIFSTILVILFLGLAPILEFVHTQSFSDFRAIWLSDSIVSAFLYVGLFSMIGHYHHVTQHRLRKTLNKIQAAEVKFRWFYNNSSESIITLTDTLKIT